MNLCAKIILLSIPLFSSAFHNIDAQNTFQIGFGQHYDNPHGYTHRLDTIRFGSYSGNKKGGISVFLAFNQKFSNKMSLEMGVNSYAINYGFFAGQIRQPFGFVTKVGYARNFLLSAPVNLKLNVNNFLYLKAGLSATFVKKEKLDQVFFTDTPAVSDAYNQMLNSFHSFFPSYGLGGGIRVWRLDLGYYFTRSIWHVGKPVVAGNGFYAVLRQQTVHQILLTYHLRIPTITKKRD